MTNLYLSICIPTNGRIEIVKNSLDSIYKDCKVPLSEFEVVLSDNSKNDELPNLLQSYSQFHNIVYKKTTCEGFLNSLHALKMGNGLFLKLHNNYTMFTRDGLYRFIEFIKQEQKYKSLIFFKSLGKQEIKRFDSFDSFNANLSFWNSWSSGFSIWKEDFEKISKVEINGMFPHTSLFLQQHYKKFYVINDIQYFINQEVSKKGGYDLFKTFGGDYLGMMEQSMIAGNITKKTFNKIKKDLFYNFLVHWYSKTKILKNEYTFHLHNIKQSISIYYSAKTYYLLVILAYIYAFYLQIKNVVNGSKNNTIKNNS